MDNFKVIWDKVKGTVAIAGVGFILGIPAAASFLGVQPIDGPAGSVCFIKTETVAPVAIIEDLVAE